MSNKNKSIKEKFIKDFGIELANKVEECAEYHANGINSKNRGSDPFKWAWLICIGYECFEKEKYRKFHKIPPEPSWEVLKSWLKKYGKLGTHDGDFDYIALFCGRYSEFVISNKRSKLKQN
jgi:hypothetical protein